MTTPKTYGALKVTGPEEGRDIIAALAAGFAITGLVEEKGGLMLCFETRNEAETARDELGRLPVAATLSMAIETIEEQNWNAEFEASLRPLRISEKITVAQTWNKDEVAADVAAAGGDLITIDPKMSFGTGDHATTRLVVNMMEGQELNGRSVLDAGTGTGLLAIVAALRGASTIAAFDNNEWSEQNARENFALNGVSGNIALYLGELDAVPAAQYDLIVANMQLPIITTLLPAFAAMLEGPDARLITSGILAVNRDDLARSAHAVGLVASEERQEDEWIATLFEPIGE